MNFIKTFLNLTQYTVPHGTESTLAKFLPNGVKMDTSGNYYIIIGDRPTTMFTCHLDTVGRTRTKVNHVLYNDQFKETNVLDEVRYIGTDGSSILGGDNKAGVCILLYLIEQKVPGVYYFFIGEEIGCVGSKEALRKNSNFFSKINRAVAYDRRAYGSIITKQNFGRECTSDEFAIALSKEFKKQKLAFKPDPTGVFTDTATFMGVIPECTNLSAGVFNEHFSTEYVDIAYTEQVAKASAKIDWEKLPTVRVPKVEVYTRNSTIVNIPNSIKNNTIEDFLSTPRLTKEDAIEMAKNSIKETVFKQEVYKKFVKVDELLTDKKLDGYKGDIKIDNILLWMEEGLKMKKKEIFHVAKKYIQEEFWNERLSNEKIEKKTEEYIKSNKKERGEDFPEYDKILEVVKNLMNPDYSFDEKIKMLMILEKKHILFNSLIKEFHSDYIMRGFVMKVKLIHDIKNLVKENC